MKNCNVCGTENVDDAKFCVACGAALEDKVEEKTETIDSSNTQRVVVDDYQPTQDSNNTNNQSAYTETNDFTYCTKCGAKIRRGVAFCTVCGASTNPNNNVRRRTYTSSSSNDKPIRSTGIGFVLGFFVGLIGLIIGIVLGDENGRKGAILGFVIRLVASVFFGVIYAVICASAIY